MRFIITKQKGSVGVKNRLNKTQKHYPFVPLKDKVLQKLMMPREIITKMLERIIDINKFNKF